jgi:hypothetical protein
LLRIRPAVAAALRIDDRAHWSPGPARRQAANIRRFIELARRTDPTIHDYWDLHRYR